jgi:hypothetical protein
MDNKTKLYLKYLIQTQTYQVIIIVIMSKILQIPQKLIITLNLIKIIIILKINKIWIIVTVGIKINNNNNNNNSSNNKNNPLIVQY